MISEILEKVGLKYEDLNQAEVATLTGWMQSIQQNNVSVDSVRTYIESMRDSVESELIDEPEFIYVLWFRVANRKHLLLKARLRNYMLLIAFLSTPEKAKQALDKALASLVANKK